MPHCSWWCNASQTSPIVMFRFFFFLVQFCVFLQRPHTAAARLTAFLFPFVPLRTLRVAASLAATQRRLRQIDLFIPPLCPCTIYAFLSSFEQLACCCIVCSNATTQHPGWLLFMFSPLVPLRSLHATKAIAARLIVTQCRCCQVDCWCSATTHCLFDCYCFSLCRFTVCVFWPLSFIVPLCNCAACVLLCCMWQQIAAAARLIFSFLSLCCCTACKQQKPLPGWLFLFFIFPMMDCNSIFFSHIQSALPWCIAQQHCRHTSTAAASFVITATSS